MNVLVEHWNVNRIVGLVCNTIPRYIAYAAALAAGMRIPMPQSRRSGIERLVQRTWSFHRHIVISRAEDEETPHLIMIYGPLGLAGRFQIRSHGSYNAVKRSTHPHENSNQGDPIVPGYSRRFEPRENKINTPLSPAILIIGFCVVVREWHQGSIDSRATSRERNDCQWNRRRIGSKRTWFARPAPDPRRPGRNQTQSRRFLGGNADVRQTERKLPVRR